MEPPQACELAGVEHGATLGLGEDGGGGARRSGGRRRWDELGFSGVLFTVANEKTDGTSILRRR